MDNVPRILAIKLTDFKGMSSIDLSLDESLTLIAGKNGVGKTSLLEALILSISNIWLHYFEPTVIYHLANPLSTAVRVGRSIAKCQVAICSPTGKLFTVTLSMRKEDSDWTLDDAEELYNDELSMTPPPIIYYSQDRISAVEPKRQVQTDEYTIDGGVNSVLQFKEWFFEKEGDEGREVKDRKDLTYSDPDLDAIRQVLTGIEGFRAIRSRLKEGSTQRVLYVDKNAFLLPFDSLSGGEKAFFILAVDLARRLKLKYPDKDLKECRAIVCVDEIELHLHPAWQRRILGELTDMFPACQFIVSTHSPQVMGGVAARNIRLLSQDEHGRVIVKVPAAAKGRDSNYILEALLDGTERDVAASKLFLEFDEHIDAGAFEEAERILGELEGIVEGGSSRVAARRIKLNRRRSKQR